MIATPRLSVIIPTRDRAELLRASIESLVDQTVPSSEYEVIVIDDGSVDHTSDVCTEMASRLPLTYQRIAPSGISAAKNLGTFIGRAPIVFFFDDDDVASPDLLEQHLLTHSEHPDPAVAVLGRTAWAPWLEVTELMRYLTDIGKFLFDYTCITHGQVLDYRWFWGGRASCKRMLLAREGIFDPAFRFGCEDIELAYRLRRHGFRVVYNANALGYMNRQVTHEAFCRRAERQGISQYHFAVQLHRDDAEIRRYCEIDGAFEEWERVRHQLPRQMGRVRELELLVTAALGGHPDHALWIAELHELYGATIRAHKVKGIAESASPTEQVAA